MVENGASIHQTLIKYLSHFRYAVMRQCWNENPDHRPTFEELSKEFESLLQSNANYLDLEPSLVDNNSYLEPNPIPTPTP